MEYFGAVNKLNLSQRYNALTGCNVTLLQNDPEVIRAYLGAEAIN